MKWSNLKQNKCPKCDKSIYGAGVKDTGQMIIHPCGFYISYKRFSKIVNTQINQDIEDKLDEEFMKGGEL